MDTKKVMYLVISCVAEAGELGIPSGHLYAALMSEVSHDEYNTVIQILLKAKMITQDNYLLRPTTEGARLGGEMGRALDAMKKAG